MHPARVCQNSLVVHGDLLFYVIAQTCLSLLFFAGLTLLARRPEAEFYLVRLAEVCIESQQVEFGKFAICDSLEVCDRKHLCLP